MNQSLLKMLYAALCGVEIMLCALYRRGYPNPASRKYADFALHLMGALTLLLLIVLPVGLVLSIRNRRGGIGAWLSACVSPLTEVVCWLLRYALLLLPQVVCERKT